jgi:hypothetical protein
MKLFFILIFKSFLFFEIYKLYNNSINLTYYYEFLYKCYNPKIIVSLTSYKKRLKTINLVIDSILNGNLVPNKIVLTLFYKDINFISENIKEYLLINKIILIIVNIDIKPHKKYFYVMQKYPYDIIITIDDDILYEKNTIELLYKSYLKYPKEISARRVHLIKYDKNGKSTSYNQWKKEYKFLKNPSFDLLATTGAGTLYPPNILKVNYSLIYDIFNCITSDDIFLKFIENKLKIKIVWVENKKLMGLYNLYHEQGMYNQENILGNDICLSNIKIEYKLIKIKKIIERLYKIIINNF